MSGNAQFYDSDKYDANELVELIKWCEGDMASHLNEIRKHNNLLVKWIHIGKFHKYIYDRIRLEYIAYHETEIQKAFYENKLKSLKAEG